MFQLSQRALRSNKFNPDRKFQSGFENFNPGSKPSNLQSRSKISIPRSFYLWGPPGVTETGSIENFNPRSIARNVLSGPDRSRHSRDQHPTSHANLRTGPPGQPGQPGHRANRASPPGHHRASRATGPAGPAGPGQPGHRATHRATGPTGPAEPARPTGPTEPAMPAGPTVPTTSSTPALTTLCKR